jgi:hypothetical protein
LVGWLAGWLAGWLGGCVRLTCDFYTNFVSLVRILKDEELCSSLLPSRGKTGASHNNVFPVANLRNITI